MKRHTIRIKAVELRAGDELVSADPIAVPDGGATVDSLICPDGESVEVWTSASPDPMGPPDVTLGIHDTVEVRR